jgi:flagellar hook-associated protein 2
MGRQQPAPALEAFMPAITSLGIGSGLDVNTMLSQLVALESRPLDQMRSVANTLQTKVSSFGQISSLFSSLQSAANKLTGSSLWNQSTASSGDASVVQVVGNSNAAAGNYSVSVTTLATNQTVVAGSSLSDADQLVGAGTLTLDIGSWDRPPMNFLPQVGRSPIDIPVTATDTLATLRDKINELGAGVSASIVTDSGGARLALRSTATGETNGFRLSVADADGNNGDAAGLSRFAFDPQNGNAQMEQKVAAVNARATVNGIEVTSASNDLSTVVEGVTLRLRKEGGASTDVSVISDREGIKAAIQGFADTYNSLVKSISDQTKYDPTSKVGGPLQGDSAATGLLRQLRSLLGSPSDASSTYKRLSDIGLTAQRDGTLAVNSTKLDGATGNLAELKKAFAGDGNGNATLDGFARRYADLATQVLGTDGTISSRTQGLRDRITRNGDDQTRLQDRVDRFKARMVAQYTAMDSNLSKLNALSTYVTQQMNALTAMANKTD